MLWDDLCDPAGIVAFRDGQLLHDWGLHPYPPRDCGGRASDPYYPRPSTHTLSTQGRLPCKFGVIYVHRGAPRGMTALSQITVNRKVWSRKSLIFRYTIFGLCLEKAIVR